MNPYAKQQEAALGAAPQQAEAWALTTAARKLAEAKTSGQAETLLGAVRLNWRLWTIFQANLAGPECGVPDEIRINLLQLANFVDKRSVALLVDPDPQKVDVLININRQIASGLLGDARPSTTAQPMRATAA
ncbi:MAG: flagellar biosynthesis regulator FlaF [Alphaproteobacteria bacterium]|nr:flagellar biosynthesis regulator FlaF [Alphaproteobacteria bacterium]